MIEERPRPIPIRIFNAIVPKVKFDIEKMKKKAMRKTGLSDFGPESLDEPFGRMIEAMEATGQLHRFGRFASRERFMNILCNRLRAQELFKTRPEIDQQKIERPVIIVGLQRTGTTKLHRLVSSHPEVRSLKSWEGLNPVPWEGDPHNRKRYAQAKLSEKTLRYMSPGFFAIHPVEWQSPEEDLLLNDMTFISQVAEAMYHVPEYALWAEEQDHLPAYTYAKRLLKYLQIDEPGRWVLKTPQHLEFLEELYTLYPDALYIHTTRDPRKCVTSFCSMVYHGRRLFSDQVDTKVVAADWIRKDAHVCCKALEFFRQKKADVMHLQYQDLVAEPLKHMREIFDRAGLRNDEEVMHTVNEHLHTHKQHRYGVHRYSMEAFGLSDADMEAAFGEYVKEFNIPKEHF